jgi:hypothetical protein
MEQRGDSRRDMLCLFPFMHCLVDDQVASVFVCTMEQKKKNDLEVGQKNGGPFQSRRLPFPVEIKFLCS